VYGEGGKAAELLDDRAVILGAERDDAAEGSPRVPMGCLSEQSPGAANRFGLYLAALGVAERHEKKSLDFVSERGVSG